MKLTAQLKKHLTSTKSICFLPGTKPISERTPCGVRETPKGKGTASVWIANMNMKRKIKNKVDLFSHCVESIKYIN